MYQITQATSAPASSSALLTAGCSVREPLWLQSQTQCTTPDQKRMRRYRPSWPSFASASWTYSGSELTAYLLTAGCSVRRPLWRQSRPRQTPSDHRRMRRRRPSWPSFASASWTPCQRPGSGLQRPPSALGPLWQRRSSGLHPPRHSWLQVTLCLSQVYPHVTSWSRAISAASADCAIWTWCPAATSQASLCSACTVSE